MLRIKSSECVNREELPVTLALKYNLFLDEMRIEEIEELKENEALQVKERIWIVRNGLNYLIYETKTNSTLRRCYMTEIGSFLCPLREPPRREEVRTVGFVLSNTRIRKWLKSNRKEVYSLEEIPLSKFETVRHYRNPYFPERDRYIWKQSTLFKVTRRVNEFSITVQLPFKVRLEWGKWLDLSPLRQTESVVRSELPLSIYLRNNSTGEFYIRWRIRIERQGKYYLIKEEHSLRTYRTTDLRYFLRGLTDLIHSLEVISKPAKQVWGNKTLSEYLKTSSRSGKRDVRPWETRATIRYDTPLEIAFGYDGKKRYIELGGVRMEVAYPKFRTLLKEIKRAKDSTFSSDIRPSLLPSDSLFKTPVKFVTFLSKITGRDSLELVRLFKNATILGGSI